MKRLKKAASAGLVAAMVIGSLPFSSIGASAAGLPTTDGHTKYINSSVFNVISDESFGTKELEQPLFDKTKGSQEISELQVPTLAYDDTSISLVWQKPEKYDNVADYNVYINGAKVGTARGSYEKNAEWADTYMKSFYNYYNTEDNAKEVEMVNVDIHAYRATDLKPDTEYTFKVVAIDADGKELGSGQTITQKTTKTPEIVNITDYGAKTSEGYTTYNDEINSFIAANTKAIQSAIDACPEGGKVVVPEGTFVTGALWLKSNMTLEVNGTLWASPNSDHFEIGFLMYPFYTDTRCWGLVNATSADEGAPLENIRITGNGTLYGNGWKYGVKDTISGDGYTSNAGASGTVQAGDPDGEKYKLPRFCGGGNTKVFAQGISAADSATKWLANITNEDGSKKYTDAQIASLKTDSAANIGKTFETADLKNAYATRSSLLIMRNVTNVYVGDVSITNPANHSVNILDSRNIATENVKVFSYDCNNGDGLGFGCSQNVICWNNFTDTGDDNLGFGASVGEGARDSQIQTNSEIWMFNNFVREGHGGLAAGSHTGNGIQDVLFEDTVMNHIDMAYRFKSAPTNGGFIANITMRDCAIADTNQGYVLTTSYADANSASTTEYAEIGQFYNFASYNNTFYGTTQNTIQVLADVDPVANPQKPWHTHHNLYFQDVTFGNVGANGSYKNKNGWETLIGCENAVFYNVKTTSYNSKAVSKKTDKAWNNIQYCKNLIFQGTTLDSLGADKAKLQSLMTQINVTDHTVKAENVEAATTEPTSASTATTADTTQTTANSATTETTANTATTAATTEPAAVTTTFKAGDIVSLSKNGTEKDGLSVHSAAGETWRTQTISAEGKDWGDTVASNGATRDIDNATNPDTGKAIQSNGTIPYDGAYLLYKPENSGKLTLNVRLQGTKRWWVVDNDGNKTELKSTTAGITKDDFELLTLNVNVEKGKTYYIYPNGHTGCLYSLTYTGKAAAADTATPMTTPEETTLSADGADTTPATETANVSDGREVRLSWTPVTSDKEVFYGVETYVDGVKVDTVEGINEPTKVISRLSSGVNYTFKVYVSKKGDNANGMNVTAVNRTLLGETEFTVSGEKDTTPLTIAKETSVTMISPVYTHAQGTWTNVAGDDARIRGYKLYSNGNLVKTLYNYQIAKYTSAATIGMQVGRLTPGVENKIQIVAFTDAGVTYNYPETSVTTLGNYDYKAPVFGAGAKLTAAKQDNGDVVLTWDAATDDTKVNGYRVYVDGTPVIPEGSKDFNPVNNAKTTAETTYTVSGLDVTKDHTFAVQAGDSWWRAETSMGDLEKLAGFNWTVKGLTTTLFEADKKDTEEKTGVDLSNGLTTGKTYGTEGLVTFEVLEDMPLNYGSETDPAKKEINGVTYDYFVQGTSGAKPRGGAIPTEGAAFKFTAEKNATITLTNKATTKTYHFIEVSADGTSVVNDLSDTIPDVLTFEVKAGKTYYYYADGSKPMVYALVIAESSASEEPTVKPTEPSKEDPTVAPTKPSTDEPTVAPTKPSTDEPTVAPTKPSTDEPTVAPTKPSTDEPAVEPTKPSTDEPAVEPTKPSTDNFTATNTENKITVEAAAGVVADGTTLKVDKIANTNTADVVKAKYTTFASFDIRLVDAANRVVQPNGKVTVSIAVPVGFNTTNLKVYYVANNALTDMHAQYNNGAMVFTVDHFSNYVLVDESSLVATDNNDTNNHATTNDTANTANNNTNTDNGSQTNKTAAAQTGDMNFAWMYAVLMLASAAGMALVVGKRKKFEK